ncbi:hypothetical protein ACS7SF_19820 (plasmid) [Ralstonia sp. 25C]|uniref:hypothetical protein n=1 Tax=Ralstonia sp. 25C TaxID=3447363 RepID=UPI003F74ED71
MSHMQQIHPAHRTRVPRRHRDSTLRHTARAAETRVDKPEWISAQTIFYIARGVAILLAAAAVGLSAASDDAERAAAAYPPFAARDSALKPRYHPPPRSVGRAKKKPAGRGAGGLNIFSL